MAATSRRLEITVISAENLQLDRKPIKKNASATVRAENDGQFRTTDMDTEGGAYPKWNEKLVLDLPMQARSLTVEVQCKTSYGVRTIGTAKIPVSDFVGGLRDHRGERNGIVNISVRMKVPELKACATTSSLSSMGFPMGDSSFGCGGVATGIPVWCGPYPKSY
ncbi:BON1-associated protein 2 [Prunus yedoensis var. nudiflora]|uniref:BON1-associated protein 2 n=1 Tax=Prunus yedoensis var. nudiflora TaxID=2094558 RepID=A0A314XHF0_PRUYE|nr:BON1-associated protein 2 [Prunus yedoensis var. nudiflora]